MENKSVQQEILLVTSATLFRREWCEKPPRESCRRLSPQEALEEACWNGALADLLPDILATSPTGKRLNLWNTRQGNGALHLELSEFPLAAEPCYSIEAWNFLPVQSTS